MTKLNLSSLACVLDSYEFNDGSVVNWRHADNSTKAKSLFNVHITIWTKTGKSTCMYPQAGPPSEHASIHWLKWHLKDHAEDLEYSPKNNKNAGN